MNVLHCGRLMSLQKLGFSEVPHLPDWQEHSAASEPQHYICPNIYRNSRLMILRLQTIRQVRNYHVLANQNTAVVRASRKPSHVREVRNAGSEAGMSWTKMMVEIESIGSPVQVLRNHRRAGNLSKETIVGTLIRFKQLKEWKFITEIIEWLRNQNWWTFSEMDYNLLIAAYGKEGKPEKVESALRTMKVSGFSPTIASYTSLIEAYGRKGLFSEAERIFQKLLVKGPAPTALTYQTIIKAFVKGEQYEDAERIFTTMTEGDAATAKPDQKLFNLMIHCYGKCGKVERASRLFRQMKAIGIPYSVVTFNSLMDCQASVKDAEAVFRQMQEEKIQPDVFTYTSLVTAYSRAKRAEEAHIVFKEMVASGIRPNRTAYNSLLNAFANSRLVEGAESVFKQMIRDRCSPDVHSYTTLMHAYISVLEIEKAEQLVKKMRAARIEPNILAFSTLMKGYAEKKDLVGMMKKYEELQSHGLKPNQTVFTIIMQAHGKQIGWESAMFWFKEMIASGLLPDERARSTLIGLSKTSDERHEVSELLGSKR